MIKKEYSFEQRKQVIDLHKKGESRALICRRTGIPSRTVSTWLYKFKTGGLENLKSDKPKVQKFAVEVKENAVRAHLENKLSLFESAKLYGVSESTLKGWVALVKRHGYAELSKPHARGYRLGKDLDCYRAKKPVISEAARPFLNGAINDTIKLVAAVSELIKIAKRQDLSDKEIEILKQVQESLQKLSSSSIQNLQVVYTLTSLEKKMITQLNNIIPSILCGTDMLGSRANKKKVETFLRRCNKIRIQQVTAEDIRNYLPNKLKMLLIDNLLNKIKYKVTAKLALIAVNLSKSSYYRFLHNKNYNCTISYLDKYNEVKEAILDIRENYKLGKTFGYRRLKILLRERGIKVSNKVILRVMQELGIQADRYKTNGKPYSSYKAKSVIECENVIKRDFRAPELGLKVYTDISEFKFLNKDTNSIDKAYLSITVDGACGIVTGFDISDSPNMKLVTKSLDMMFDNVPKHEGKKKIFHSDRGWHYNMDEVLLILEQHGYTRSMSAKGCCMDNGLMEGFFGIMKSEFLYSFLDNCNNATTFDELRSEITQYINWYNNERPSEKAGFNAYIKSLKIDPNEFHRFIIA